MSDEAQKVEQEITQVAHKVKEVFAPHLGRTIKLGRFRPKVLPKMRFEKYLDAAAFDRDIVIPPATSYRNAAGMANALADVMLNDSLGDCTCAAIGHLVASWTANAGQIYVPTDAQILALYEAVGGYKPGDPSTDQGADEATVLNYLTQNPLPNGGNGNKLLGWLGVDATDPGACKRALFMFGGLYSGLELPDSYVTPFPSASGFTWGVDQPDPNNGHAVPFIDYDDGLGAYQLATWGLVGNLTYDAAAQLCVESAGGQLYALLSADQVAAGQTKAPNGIDWTTLLADFDAMAPTAPPDWAL